MTVHVDLDRVELREHRLRRFEAEATEVNHCRNSRCVAGP